MATSIENVVKVDTKKVSVEQFMRKNASTMSKMGLAQALALNWNMPTADVNKTFQKYGVKASYQQIRQSLVAVGLNKKLSDQERASRVQRTTTTSAVSAERETKLSNQVDQLTKLVQMLAKDKGIDLSSLLNEESDEKEQADVADLMQAL